MNVNKIEFLSRLSGKTLGASDIVVSLDVVSLFTNVPLDLAINSINNKWNYIAIHTSISRNEFILAIKFILLSTYFLFNDKIYKQTYGTPLSFPFSPIIANLVMQNLEELILSTMDTNIHFYYHYVDDMILVAPVNKVTTF
ncbi:hypothetical protein ACFW04_013054 [Cataglyphis niger]